ncbi:unnamed protein product [Calicophoron daubneyi]|uniref:Smr domain-containing protein n=1 Tax=Calicophoron daubneyi TaxID=300641 RepID=A0AAV2TCS8_CALDB
MTMAEDAQTEIESFPVPPDDAQHDKLFYSPKAERLECVLREASMSNWSSRYLVLIRGLPGSGKSTLARFLVRNVSSSVIASFDDYLLAVSHSSRPVYRSAVQAEAVAACKQKVWSALQNGVAVVVVDNENLQVRDMEPYIDEAVKNHYSVSLIEPDTPWRYNVRKLCKYTSKPISSLVFKDLLNSFDRTVTAEDLVSSAERRLHPVQLSPPPPPLREAPPTFDASVDLVQAGEVKCSPSDSAEQSPVTSGIISSVSGPSSGSTAETHASCGETSPDNQIEETPVAGPSYVADELDELRAVFPKFSRGKLKEYLDLAHGDAQWASSLILEGLECSDSVKSNLPDDSEASFSSDTAAADTRAVASIDPPVITENPEILPTNSETPASEKPEEELDVEHPAVLAHSESVDGPAPSASQLEESKGEKKITVSRSFIREAHERYAYASDLQNVQIDAIPDFLFEEWSPEPELQRAIYHSFMHQIGLLKSQSNRSPYQPKYTISSSAAGRSKGLNVARTSDREPFTSVLQQDEAMYRSVEDFRSSLDAPVVRRIIDRLLAKFPGVQRFTVEEAFVQSNFSESATELQISRNFKPPTNSTPSSSVGPRILNNEDTQNKELGEKLSLREIQDEEEALHRSVEDQRHQLRPLANQLSLHRIKAKFPGVQMSLLEDLFIKFDLNEEKVTEDLIARGFSPQPVPPLITSGSEVISRESSPPGMVHSELLKASLQTQISHVRQRIGHIRQCMYSQKDKRANSYYTTELRDLYRQLHFLLMKRAQQIVSARSSDFEKRMLAEGDAPVVASAKALAYIDLHALDKSCAMAVLRQRLQAIEQQLQHPTPEAVSCAIVITGRGGSAETDVVHTSPILRPAVLNYFEKNGYQYVEKYCPGSGSFTVRLPAKIPCGIPTTSS